MSYTHVTAPTTGRDAVESSGGQYDPGAATVSRATKYLVTDERGMDPDQFDDVLIYDTADTLEEARSAQRQAGCGVIIRCSVEQGVYSWEEYIP